MGKIWPPSDLLFLEWFYCTTFEYINLLLGIASQALYKRFVYTRWGEDKYKHTARLDLSIHLYFFGVRRTFLVISFLHKQWGANEKEVACIHLGTPEYLYSLRDISIMLLLLISLDLYLIPARGSRDQDSFLALPTVLLTTHY